MTALICRDVLKYHILTWIWDIETLHNLYNVPNKDFHKLVVLTIQQKIVGEIEIVAKYQNILQHVNFAKFILIYPLLKLPRNYYFTQNLSIMNSHPAIDKNYDGVNFQLEHISDLIYKKVIYLKNYDISVRFVFKKNDHFLNGGILRAMFRMYFKMWEYSCVSDLIEDFRKFIIDRRRPIIFCREFWRGHKFWSDPKFWSYYNKYLYLSYSGTIPYNIIHDIQDVFKLYNN